MIAKLKEKHIRDTAHAQLLAWQKSFRGILSDQLLASLKIEEFESSWKAIIQRTERKNLVWLNEEEKAVGFVSFGKPNDKNESADFEIYGIYVHPAYWKQKIGFVLMKSAIEQIRKHKPKGRIILWVMKKNLRSRKFYEQFGFLFNSLSRTSVRNREKFEEVQYKFDSNKMSLLLG